MMAHEDHGDVTWGTGSAVVENVVCTDCVGNTDLAANSVDLTSDALSTAYAGTGIGGGGTAALSFAAADVDGTGLTGSGTTLSVDASQTQVTGLGTITTGTWSATDVAVAAGGTGSSTAGGAITNLGASTVGGNVFTLTNPSAIRFLRMNADNTVSALSDSAFRTAIGAGTSSTSGTVTSVGSGTGIGGGAITTSGTLHFDASDVTDAANDGIYSDGSENLLIATDSCLSTNATGLSVVGNSIGAAQLADSFDSTCR
jgi:hypothetical protein